MGLYFNSIKNKKDLFSFFLLLFFITSTSLFSQYLDPDGFSSLGPFNPSGNVTVSMNTRSMSGGVTATGVMSGGILVFTFDSFTLGSGYSITFTNVTDNDDKIAFLSQGNMTISGNIYANASESFPGPGGRKGGFSVGQFTPEAGYGTGGGKYDNGADNTEAGAGGGGFGGSGGDAGYGALGGVSYGNLATSLDGGSGGAASYYGDADQYGGGGGGALELGASATLILNSGCHIEAKGAAGTEAPDTGSDGNGGGSGGGILVHAKTVINNTGANIDASGGDGGIGGTSGGGGGGGGGGGRIRLAYHSSGAGPSVNNGTNTAAGGAGGPDAGNPGDPGSPGVVQFVQDDNVPFTTPEITFTDGSGFTPSVAKGSTNQVLGRFQLSADVAGASLTATSIQLNGIRTGLSNLKLWSSPDATFESGSDTQLGSTVAADPGDGSSASFSAFSNPITTSNVYYFVTGDVASNATGAVQGMLVNNSSLTIASGNLSGTITNAPLSNGDASLPVELASFSATQKGNSVAVEWTTASETDNLGFIIERQYQNSTWDQIASYHTHSGLVGQGTASSPKLYSYTDKDVTAGGSYTYRLSDVDVNGQVNILATTEVTAAVTPTTTQLFPAYPNPFNPQTTLTYQLAQDAHVTLAVYDVLGRQVKLLANHQQSAGEYTATWDGMTDAGLASPSGTYLVRMQAGPVMQNQKMLLIK